jgi:copper chaperone
MKAKIEIQNLKCGGCANTIKTKLERVLGIVNVSIEVESSTLSFAYEHEKQYEFAIDELNSMGYPMVGKTNNLSRKAKSYISCAIGKIEKK